MTEVRSASAPAIRASSPSAGGGAGAPTMFGHFAAFNQWTEINSTFEGNFMERIAPGSFSKTLAHDRNGLRVLFQHGWDPSIGDKVLGIPTLLREDDLGAAYEVPLLDTSYNRDLIPGLRAGAYGASFRFKVIRENLDNTAPASSYNPKALPERTITEAKVMEFGPVTFPAYEGATAGIRSLTDLFLEQAVAA
jgi:HK97 family phage prohead protease